MADTRWERNDFEFWEIHPAEVKKADWPFANHLNELHNRWIRLRRVLRIVKCLNPETGALDLAFAELVDDQPRFPDSEVTRYACIRDQDFFSAGIDLRTSLCDALGVLSPESYRSRVEHYFSGDKSDAAVACLNYAERMARQRSRTGRMYFLTFLLHDAHAVVCRWESELDALRSGDILSIWRHWASVGGARRGGDKAASTRTRIAEPSRVLELRRRLIEEGRPAHNVASIIASRIGVSSNHVRSIIRGESDQPPVKKRR